MRVTKNQVNKAIEAQLPEYSGVTLESTDGNTYFAIPEELEAKFKSDTRVNVKKLSDLTVEEYLEKLVLLKKSASRAKRAPRGERDANGRTPKQAQILKCIKKGPKLTSAVLDELKVPTGKERIGWGAVMATLREANLVTIEGPANKRVIALI